MEMEIYLPAITGVFYISGRLVLGWICLVFAYHIFLIAVLRRAVRSGFLLFVNGALLFAMTMTGSHNAHKVQARDEQRNQQNSKPE